MPDGGVPPDASRIAERLTSNRDVTNFITGDTLVILEFINERVLSGPYGLAVPTPKTLVV